MPLPRIVSPAHEDGVPVGGLAEPAVIVATLALLTLTPWATQRFWLIAGAGIAFVVE
jgi:hypothetical protein